MSYFFVIHAHIPESSSGAPVCFKYLVCMN